MQLIIPKFDSVLSILPDKNPEIINQFNGLPQDRLINQIKNSKKTSFVLITSDPWFKDYYKNFLEFAACDQRKFYILTLEYENYWIADNIAVISFPGWYFTRTSKPFNPKPQGLPYGVSCLNRLGNGHRLLLGIHLYQAKLLDKIIWTQNYSDENLPESGYANTLICRMDPYNEYRDLLPINPYESSYAENDHTTDHVAYTQAYCNIVTETAIEYFYHDGVKAVPSITEKSFKPFISSQLPIFFASPGHYAYLRSLGFDPMEDLIGNIDHMGTMEKCTHIRDILLRGREYFEEFYFTNLDRVQYNHQLVSSSNVDKKILQNIKDFLNF